MVVEGMVLMPGFKPCKPGLNPTSAVVVYHCSPDVQLALQGWASLWKDYTSLPC